MDKRPRVDISGDEREPHAPLRVVRGVLAGGGVLIAVMLLLAGLSVAMGLIARDEAGRLDLGPWLALEVVGGAVASVVAGKICRRIVRSYRGPVVLALCVFSIGVLEAAEILRQTAAGGVEAPTWLVLFAPVVAGAGVLIGGWLPGTRLHWLPQGKRTGLAMEVLRYSSPVVVLIAAAMLSIFVLPGLAVGAESRVVASAITLDLTVVAPGLVFLLLVRAQRAPWFVIIPTFVVGYAVAMATIPTEHQAVLEMIGLLVAPAEVGVIVYLVVLARRAFASASLGEGDFATRFRSAARKVLASRIPADIITTEVSILYYALGWRRAARLGPGSYTVHRKVGYLAVLIGLAMVLVIETVAVHVLMSQWSPFAAWILTTLSIYALLWLVGDYRAMQSRPLRITANQLLLRVGVRWEADIPRDCIERVERLAAYKESPKKGTLVAALLGQANVRLRLKRPIEVVGMYGIQRRADEIWLTVDGAEAFCKEAS